MVANDFTRTVTVDGSEVRLVFVERERPRWISPKTSNRWDRGYMSATQAEYNKKPRLYVTVKGESLLDNLANRTTRPVNVWGKAVRKALAALELGGRVGWYAKAGCGMCPCSPGFVWSDAPAFDFGDGYAHRRYDVYATLADAPTVRTDEAAQLTQLGRLSAVAADPTLPLEALANTVLSV